MNFAGVNYALEQTPAGQYQFVRKYSGTPSVNVTLLDTVDEYEMFAFCASSTVAPMGSIADTVIPSVFANGQDLREFTLGDGTTKWNAKKTGHSAQFIHSYSAVKAYWAKLIQDIR